MILYLLFTLLILGNVEPQRANMTEEERIEVQRNRTLGDSSYSGMKPDNVTTFHWQEDEKRIVEEELQSNRTSEVITEDDERFQQQEVEFPGRHCLEDELVSLSHYYCGAAFDVEMMSIGAESWCVLHDVIGPYNAMTLCLENLCPLVGCYYPNPTVEDFFLDVHSHYFHNCTVDDLDADSPRLVDAPHSLVMALTLLPVGLIPVLVYLVVWKSSVRE